MAVDELRFSLAIPAQEWLAFYQGVRDVVVRAHDGRTVRFPARHLRPFVTRAGVFGEFCLRVDGSRLVSLRRLEPQRDRPGG